MTGADGKAIRIASTIDELETVFAEAGGPPRVLRMDTGPEFISQALQQFCDAKTGTSYIPPGAPWNNGYIEPKTSSNNWRADAAGRSTPARRRLPYRHSPARRQQQTPPTRHDR